MTVGASSLTMFLVTGFCNGSCAGFAIPIAQSFGAKNLAASPSTSERVLEIYYKCDRKLYVLM